MLCTVMHFWSQSTVPVTCILYLLRYSFEVYICIYKQLIKTYSCSILVSQSISAIALHQ